MHMFFHYNNGRAVTHCVATYTVSPVPGADPEVEEGGGGGGHRYRVGLVRPCGARSAPNFFRERIMHSVLGRSGGMLLYRFRECF